MPHGTHPRGPHPRGTLRYGTSSWSEKSWVGPFYPEGTQPGDYLRHYATVFDTVEADVTYYRVPDRRLVDGWNEKTPDGFVLSAKFPRGIVHGGDGPKPDGSKVLLPEHVRGDTDRFLEYWNHVFMTYELHEDGSLTDLPAKNIDTGMGLERMAAILQGVPSVFDSMKFSMPCLGWARNVPPGMMIIHSVFQTDRPMSRASETIWSRSWRTSNSPPES